MAGTPGTVRFPEVSAKPSAPPAGYCLIYAKTDNVLYLQDSSAVEVPLGSASSITQLTGDVTATGPGSVPATVVTVGGASAANIASAVSAYLSATNLNTPSTIVERDSSGNFLANIITAALNGNASTATTSISFSGSLSGDVTGTQFSTVVSTVGGSTAANIHTAEQAANAATASNTASTIVERNASGNFSANIITASLSGNASTATNATNFTGSLSGDVTGGQSSTVVATVGGSSASNIHSAEVATNSATASNTASTIVKRDASGNFVANNITASLTGNVSGSAASFTGSLSGDVTGTQGSTVVSSVDGYMAAQVGASISLTQGATSSNTPSTLVERDISGNFVANNITASLIGAASLNVLKSGDTMSGTLNMGNNPIIDLPAPVNPSDAVNKNYVDAVAQGLFPQPVVLDVRDIDDSLSTPPVSPTLFASYIINSSPTGAWSTIGAGHIVYWNGSTWIDILNGSTINSGDRLGIDFHNIGAIGGSFIGHHNQIATVTNATPGSYAYTFETPSIKWSVAVDNPYSYDSGDVYYFDGTQWYEVSSGSTLVPGIAISILGNMVNVLYDGTSISVNGFNQLEVVGVGGKTAADVATATGTVDAATNLNTPLTLVERDSSGNFAAGTITATLSGNASNITATTNSTLTTLSALSLPGSQVTGNISGNAANITATSNSTLTTLSSLSLPGTQVSGNISGNAANITGTLAISHGGTGQTTQAAALTALVGTQAVGEYLRSDGTNTYLQSIQSSDVPTLNQNTTGSAGSISGTNVITNTNLVQMPANTLKGNNTGSTANAADLTVSQVNTLLGDVTTLATFASSPNANAASISGNTLTLQPASDSFPGGVSTGTQTFAGSKTLGAAASDKTTIGTTSSTAVQQVNGGQSGTVHTITSSTYTVDSTTTDYIIYTDSTSNTITITLPPPTAGRILVIEDKTAQASTNFVTVNPNASEKINGLSSFVISQNYGSIRITSDGTNWFITSSVPNVTSQILPVIPIASTIIDWSLGNIYTKTLSANTTFTFSNATAGQTLIVRLTNTASNYTVTWPSMKWPVQTSPVMTTGAFSDVYTIIYDGSNYYGSYVQNF